MEKLKIGVGITTRNRAVSRATIDKWRINSPGCVKVVVVDDCSETPFAGADYRFSENVGIARAKNKCIELLDDCDHIFLADDDIYPMFADWWFPYVTSEINHLQLNFEKRADGEKLSSDVFVKNAHSFGIEYNMPNGCLLYMKKVCIETVGGFDPNYGFWGLEHAEYSRRIHLAGLTPYPYLSLPRQTEVFFAYDFALPDFESSVRQDVRIKGIRDNTIRFNNVITSKYIPYE